MPKSTRKREVSSLAQRRRIQQCRVNHPRWRLADFVNHMKVTENLSIGESAVSRILKMDLSQEPPPGRNGEMVRSTRQSNWPELELALYVFYKIKEASGVVSSDMIFDAAHRLWKDIYPKEAIPKFQIGWFRAFSRRNGLKYGMSRRNTGDVHTEAKQDMFSEIRAEIAKYDIKDVYNCDESAVYWKRKHKENGTSSSNALSGIQNISERVTVPLCCNADGSDKLPLWIIGHSQNPRCFEEDRENLTNLNCVYRSNQSAWMSTKIMTEWLRSFNNHVARRPHSRAGGKVLLILDNFSAHLAAVREAGKLSHTNIIFVPSTSTSITQPLKQGIIKAFKRIYRKRWLRFMVDNLSAEKQDPVDSGVPMDPGDPVHPMDSMDEVRAIKWLIDSWNQLTPPLIANCWRHTGLLPSQAICDKASVEEESVEEEQIEDDSTLLDDLARLRQAGYLTHDSSVEEFIDPEDEVVGDGEGDCLLESLAIQFGENMKEGEGEDLGQAGGFMDIEFDVGIAHDIEVEDAISGSEVVPPQAVLPEVVSQQSPTKAEVYEMLEKIGQFELMQENAFEEFNDFKSKYEKHLKMFA